MQERLTDAEKLAHVLMLIEDEVALAAHQRHHCFERDPREAAVYGRIKRFLTNKASRGYCEPGRYPQSLEHCGE